MLQFFILDIRGIMKKGFTLAEILIVLMVIGVIAMLTIPAVMKGVTFARYKTAFKKSYNVIRNLSSTLKVKGENPSKGDSNDVIAFFDSVSSLASVSGYADKSVGHGSVPTDNSGFYSEIKEIGSISAGEFTDWIITDDNFAYSIFAPSGAKCLTAAAINASATAAEAMENSCLVVVVDVNGLYRGPNMIDTYAENGISADEKLTQLLGDQYYIFVGNDSAASGDSKTTLSGRILSGVN